MLTSDFHFAISRQSLHSFSELIIVACPILYKRFHTRLFRNNIIIIIIVFRILNLNLTQTQTELQTQYERIIADYYNIRPFPLWVPLFGIVSHLKSALFHGICPARFTSSLKLLFLPGPGLGAPLSSYLEVALYKFHR